MKSNCIVKRSNQWRFQHHVAELSVLRQQTRFRRVGHEFRIFSDVSQYPFKRRNRSIEFPNSAHFLDRRVGVVTYKNREFEIPADFLPSGGVQIADSKEN